MLQQPDDFGIGRLFWVMSDAIVGADLVDERIVLWNPAAEALFGYTAAEALGARLSMLVPDELLDAHHAGIGRYRDGGSPVLVGGAAVEVPAITRSGERRTVELALTDISENSARNYVVALIRDVTELHRARHEVERMNEAMREFIATTSHDLRTPLASMLGFAEVLDAKGDDLGAEQRSTATAAIARGAQRALRLVDSLFTLSQVDAGVMTRNPATVVARAAIDEAVVIAGVEAAVDAPDELRLTTDPGHLHRMLVNLLDNAAKYGSPPITVTAAPVEGGLVEIAVCDGGAGVPDTLADRLFERFSRGDPSRKGGAGLGLSIVRGLAETNEGEAFHDHAAAGSRFGIRLPAADPEG